MRSGRRRRSTARPCSSSRRRCPCSPCGTSGSCEGSDGQRLLLALVPVVRAELLLERPFQVTRRLELLDDVGAADQLPADEDLRDRRPARLGRELLADRRIRKHVDCGDRRARAAERLECPQRVAAHHHLGRALHEQGDVLALDHLPDVRAQVGHHVPFVLIRNSWIVPSASGPASASLTRRCWSISESPSKRALATVTWKWSPVPVRSCTSSSDASGNASPSSVRSLSVAILPI